MPLPHIAAGDWMSKMGPMASFMKNAGAFVIRRSFQPQPDDGAVGEDKEKGNENIYAAVFSSYLQQLLKDGQSVEFFLEGTRSRTGKSLTPKTGMLGAIVEPWLKAHPELYRRSGGSGGSSGSGGSGGHPTHRCCCYPTHSPVLFLLQSATPGAASMASTATSTSSPPAAETKTTTSTSNKAAAGSPASTGNRRYRYVYRRR